MGEPAKAQGILRTLEVLRTLNVAKGSTVSQLHALTRISRPALYRILQCFADAGYVTRDDAGGYHLTHLVRSLSEGFRDEDRVAQLAAPVLDSLTRKVLWPADLAVFGNHAMHVRETTRPRSSLVMDRGRVGYQLPMFGSAVGIAYLAFCPDAQREAILEALASSDHPYEQVAKDPRRVAQILKVARSDGYASRYRGAVPETGSIAVPLFGPDGFLACLAITYFSSVLKPADAAKRYVSDLKAAAREIESQLAAQARQQ